ncbi:MAG: GMC family oxidoreductase [Myxococcales bacterium]|nr:GMC family oxidoreductase [Myxococcales bacterium]
MSGRVMAGRALEADLSLEAEIVVCGAGAGGCMAARELARAGRSVIVLEQGKDHRIQDFSQREDEMIPALFDRLGGQRSEDLAILILSGRGLGGSTIHNQNLCKRTPDAVLEAWADAHGVEGVEPSTMRPLFEEVERDLGVRPITDAQVNLHNRRIQRGVEALGYAGARLQHNRDERCIGSGFCELGCAYDGKLNARRVLVPQAVSAGAIFVTDARVDRIVHDGEEIQAIEGRLLDATGRPRGSLRVRTSRVCLAGSAIGSAALALRSELPDPHARLGRSLRIHPASIVAGRFEDRLLAWRGIPQSYECTEFLDFSAGSERRVWLIPSFAHPIGTASLIPGFGPELMEGMREYPHLGALAAMVHDETEGRIYLDGDAVRIQYEPIATDREQLALGSREAARILLRAGATRCTIPASPPLEIRAEADLETIVAERFLPHDAKLTAVHPMGSMRMGGDPRRSVVDARGRHHQLRGLAVTDGSLFPTSIGGPPQISIYTFAMKVARHLIDEWR